MGSALENRSWKPAGTSLDPSEPGIIQAVELSRKETAAGLAGSTDVDGEPRGSLPERRPARDGWSRRGALLLAAGYLAAMVIATAPAIASFSSEFMVAEPEARPGLGEAAAGDHLQAAYWLWLPGHQLEHGGAPWRDPYSFQPIAPPQLNPAGWPFALAFWPLEAALGPVLAWNLLLLLAGVGGGLATAAWLRRLGLSPEAAALGGLAFAIAPYRLMQSGSHLLGLVAVLLPVALWAYERCRSARSGRERVAFGMLCALAIVSIPLSGQVHLALGAVPFLAAYAVVRSRGPALAWAAAGVAAAIAVGLLMRETVIEESAAGAGRSLAEVDYYSAEGLDLLSRSPRRGLEHFAYLGWLVPLLGVAGVAVLVRRRKVWLAAVLAVGVLVPVLLALGTNFPLYEPLRDVFPPLRFPRVPGRLLPIATLALAALAAVAVAAATGRLAHRRRTVVALVALLVAADLLVFPLRNARADPDNAAYAAVAAAPEGRILELPVLPRGLGHFGSVYLYYALQAPRERPTGYSTLAPDTVHDFTQRYRGLNCGRWREGDAAGLEQLGVTRLVFHSGVFGQAGLPGAWFAWQGLQRQGLRAEAGRGAVWVFGRSNAAPESPPVPEPDRGRPVYCDGWLGHGTAGGDALLWVWGSEAALELDAVTPGSVTISVDGEPRGSVEVPSDTVAFELGAPGWHLVELVDAAPGIRAEIATSP